MHAIEQSEVLAKPNSTATRSGATRAMYQLETMLLCNASQELDVFIPDETTEQYCQH